MSGRFWSVYSHKQPYIDDRGNRLLKVTDKGDACTVTGATDFNDGANIAVEYTYDACGARTSDANKGIAGIQYSYWGTPELIQFTNGSQTRCVYDASGVKQKRIHITAVNNIVVPLKTVMELSDDQILASDTDIRHNGIWIEENKKNWGTLINFISGKVKNKK